MRRLTAIVAAILATSAAAAPPPARPMVPRDIAPDYGRVDSWLCRPGHDAPCAVDLDAMAVDAQLKRTLRRFVAARDPKIDCFYVYPTVSNDPTMFSDMLPDQQEKGVVAQQAARLASVCRLYVPIYRQFTHVAMLYMVGGAGLAGLREDHDRPYRDVRAAWRSYLAYENRGRGVVLVGHSQGATLLTQLIAEEIDGKPAQKQLVSAILAGNMDLTVARGSEVGGSFRSVPLCRTNIQTGCAIAWSSYLASDKARDRFFGGNRGDPARDGACVNPAAPGGGRGSLKAYFPKPATAPAGDPPFVLAIHQLTAECTSDAQGNVLRVAIASAPSATLLAGRFSGGPARGWGLHRFDMDLAMGNLLDVLATQAAAWQPRR